MAGLHAYALTYVACFGPRPLAFLIEQTGRAGKTKQAGQDTGTQALKLHTCWRGRRGRAYDIESVALQSARESEVFVFLCVRERGALLVVQY